MLESFALFPALPLELRYLIWEHSFQPRTISLLCQSYCGESSPENFPFKSFLQPPVDINRSRGEVEPVADIDIRLHFAASGSIEPAVILQVCRESRHFAILRGYVPWILKDVDKCVRQVMWNAALDTISLSAPHRQPLPRFYGELFRRQFPVEAKVVQSLAVPSCSWKSRYGETSEVGECWVEYAQLKTLVVVLGNPFQFALSRLKGRTSIPNTLEADAWALPRGVRETLDKLASRRSDAHWKVPTVLVVRDEGMILRAGEMEMCLECKSCKSLEIECQKSLHNVVRS